VMLAYIRYIGAITTKCKTLGFSTNIAVEMLYELGLHSKYTITG
jgi:hypothetical protein